jgi:hypothetical protein
MMWTTQDTEEDVLGGSPDFVIDAIDNIDTKVCPPCRRRSSPSVTLLLVYAHSPHGGSVSALHVAVALRLPRRAV